MIVRNVSKCTLRGVRYQVVLMYYPTRIVYCTLRFRRDVVIVYQHGDSG